MAVQYIGKNVKRCATCEYWKGEREIRGGSVGVYDLTDVHTKARCSNPNARLYTQGKEVCANACCGTYWEQWSESRF